MTLPETLVPLNDSQSLLITELSRHTFDSQDVGGVGGDGGLFLVLEDTDDDTFAVLAKVVEGQEATLRDLLFAIAP